MRIIVTRQPCSCSLIPLPEGRGLPPDYLIPYFSAAKLNSDVEYMYELDLHSRLILHTVLNLLYSTPIFR